MQICSLTLADPCQLLSISGMISLLSSILQILVLQPWKRKIVDVYHKSTSGPDFLYARLSEPSVRGRPAAIFQQ